MQRLGERWCGHCYKLTQANQCLRLSQQDVTLMRRFVRGLWRRWVNGEGSAASPWIRERLAEDPSPGVRAEAAYRLGLLSDPEARAALNTTIAKDPDSGVRRWAKRGM